MSLSSKFSILVSTKTLQRGRRWENSDIETRDSTCCFFKETRQYKYYKTRQCHMRQYIGINQKAMASTYETTMREPGIMMRSHINQSSHIKPQSVTALSVCQ